MIKHRTFGRVIPPSSPAAGHEVDLPSAKQLGASRRSPEAFRPASVVNVSAMSFGSLSGPAIEALNRGATLAGCLQNTGEGGVSPCHRNGGELIFQIGTAYFGCRDGHPRECDLADITPPTRTASVAQPAVPDQEQTDGGLVIRDG